DPDFGEDLETIAKDAVSQPKEIVDRMKKLLSEGHHRENAQPRKRFELRRPYRLEHVMAQLKWPNCGREFVRRVSRSGLLEVLLSYFYVYPFKCQLCGERFRQCEWGVRYVRVDEDRREYERMEISFPVSFFGQDISGEGIVIGLSMGGCTLQTQIKVE